ncbi:MlaD family protein [Pimelobacter simplex]|uniref:MlaD family protein n=1 Tax=Nocardioides simplex TaxID=2045 RepID=UPI0020B13374|nr:MlaD family protein [Pimelobacter simplex]
MSTSRNATTISAAIKLAVFTVVSVLVTGLLAVIMGNVGFGDRNQYQAIFANATMLEKGDDVRVAGVNVGEVKKVEHYRRTMAKVTFKVDAGVKLTSASLAKIRFLNLVGDRYMALEQGTGADDAKPLADGAPSPPTTPSPHSTSPSSSTGSSRCSPR